MAINNFIPKIWSAKILQNLQKSLVYGQTGVINRDYEGEISQFGDTVHINSIGPVTIGNYTKNTNISDPETLNDSQRSLVIDQAKYFNFQVDDVDKAQQKPKVMGEAIREASYGLRDAADKYIASLYTGVATGNTIGDDTTPVVPTKTDIYDYFVDLAILLDDAKISREGRWTIVPPWVYGLLQKTDQFTHATAAGDDVIRNGVVGSVAGFTVLVSHNVPNATGTKYKIISGHSMAWSYAEQINSVEAYRPEKRFADALKGLHLYGGKLVRPEAIAVMTANKS